MRFTSHCIGKNLVKRQTELNVASKETPLKTSAYQSKRYASLYRPVQDKGIRLWTPVDNNWSKQEKTL